MDQEWTENRCTFVLRGSSLQRKSGVTSGAWRFAKEGGTVEKKSRVPSLTQEGPENFCQGGSIAFFCEVQIQRRTKAPRPQWSRRHWVSRTEFISYERRFHFPMRETDFQTKIPLLAKRLFIIRLKSKNKKTDRPMTSVCVCGVFFVTNTSWKGTAKSWASTARRW